MLAAVFEDLGQVSERMESVITFTVTRFVYTVLLTYMGNMDIVIMGLVGTVACKVANDIQLFHADGAATLITTMFGRLNMFVGSQALMHSVTQNERIVTLSRNRDEILLHAFTVMTCLLVMISVIPDSIAGLGYVQRFITLLLFMYTDATEYIVRSLDVGVAPALCGILVCLYMHSHEEYVHTLGTTVYLVRAINMLSINVILAQITETDAATSSLEIRTTINLFALFTIDAASKLVPAFAEVRGYAVWKTASRLFEEFSATSIDPMLTVYACVTLMCARRYLKEDTATLMELMVLVVVNILADSITSYASVTASVTSILVMFLYIIVIHLFSNAP